MEPKYLLIFDDSYEELPNSKQFVKCITAEKKSQI